MSILKRMKHDIKDRGAILVTKDGFMRTIEPPKHVGSTLRVPIRSKTHVSFDIPEVDDQPSFVVVEFVLIEESNGVRVFEEV